MNTKPFRTAVLASLVAQIALGAPVEIKWAGSYPLDTRPAPKRLATAQDLANLRPFVVETAGAVVKAKNPDTGIAAELDVAWGADGVGQASWSPTASGLWTISRTGGYSATMTFDVAWSLFHGGEAGTAESPYGISSVAAFKTLAAETAATNVAPGVAVGTYLKLDTAWVGVEDIYAAYPEIPAVTQELVDETGAVTGTVTVAEAVPLKYTAIADGLCRIDARQPGESPYASAWDGTVWNQATDTFKLDTTKMRTVATTGEVVTASTTLPQAFTFEKGQRASLRVYNPNTGAWTYLKGSATRPDGSGEIAWTAPSMGGIYRVQNESTGLSAYYSVPYSVSGEGTEASPLVIPTTALFGELLEKGELAAGDGKVFRLVGTASASGALAALEKGTGLSYDDELDAYTLVATSEQTPLATTTATFSLATKGTVDENGVYTRSVTSLSEILPVAYAADESWTANDYSKLGSLAFAVTPVGSAEETDLGAIEVRGIGTTNFTPNVEGAWRLVNTDAAGTATTAYIALGSFTPSVETTVSTAAELQAALDTLGLETAVITLGADITTDEKGAYTYISVPETVRSLTINLAGYTLSGFNSTDKTAGVTPLRLLGAETDLTVVGPGTLKGGDGADATELSVATRGWEAVNLAAGYVGTVTVQGGAKVLGGNGGGVAEGFDGAASFGGPCLYFKNGGQPVVVVKDASEVRGGNGGDSASGNGGNGGVAIQLKGTTGATIQTEDAALSLTVLDTSVVAGGNGGSSANKTAGNGAPAASTPASTIASGSVTVSEGASVAGGDAGSAGATGTAGTGGTAVAGSAEVEGDVTDGSKGEYVVSNAEDLAEVMDNYVAKAGDGSLNVKLDENADIDTIEVPANVAGISIDLNGNSVDSVVVSGSTQTTLSDTAETKGTVGTLAASGGSSVTVEDASVDTVDSDGADLTLAGGTTVGEVKGTGTLATTGEATVTGDSAIVETVLVEVDDSTDLSTLSGPVTLKLVSDITHTLAVPAAVTALTVNLNGFSVTGDEGAAAIAYEGAAEVAIIGTGTLKGGDGADNLSGVGGTGAAAVSAAGGYAAASTVTLVDGADGLGRDTIPTVKIVKVQQRYPWNGMVDIDYTLSGNVDRVKIVMTYKVCDADAVMVDEDSDKWYVKPVVEAGTHRATWDALNGLVDGTVGEATITLTLIQK